MATNGASARGLSACSERANSSLPVPLSPSSSTVVSVVAARCSDANTLRSDGSSPTSCGAPRRTASSSFISRFSVTMRRCSRARRDQQQQMIGIDRLGEKVERPFLHRRDRILDAAVGGHHDDRHVGVDFLRRAQHAEAVAVRQPQIGEHERRLGLLQLPDRLRLIARLEDGVALTLERMPEHRPQRVLVFDEENLGGSGHAGAQRSQPGGTPALRASSSMSAICFCRPSISEPDALQLRRSPCADPRRCRARWSRVVAADEVRGEAVDARPAARRAEPRPGAGCSRGPVMRARHHASSFVLS